MFFVNGEGCLAYGSSWHTVAAPVTTPGLVLALLFFLPRRRLFESIGKGHIVGWSF